MKVIIFLLASVVAAQASLFDWNALQVTWNAVPFLGWDNVPRQVSEIKGGNFELKDDLCATSKGKMVGQRYWNKQDPTLMLLFDKNGFIAGIQNSFPKSKYTPPAQLQNKNYVDDGDYWTLSAYFIDPSLICGAGRTKEDFDKTGTGTGLWVHMGPDPIKDSYHVPMAENDIKPSKWGHGRCFPTMGKHYWYNVTKDMDCKDMVPNCLLYNGGKLTSFCFSTNGNYQSNRFDNPHPSASVIKAFMDPEPDCFFTEPSYKIDSTIHVFFNSNARLGSLC